MRNVWVHRPRYATSTSRNGRVYHVRWNFKFYERERTERFRLTVWRSELFNKIHSVIHLLVLWIILFLTIFLAANIFREYQFFFSLITIFFFVVQNIRAILPNCFWPNFGMIKIQNKTRVRRTRRIDGISHNTSCNIKVHVCQGLIRRYFWVPIFLCSDYTIKKSIIFQYNIAKMNNLSNKNV